MMTKEKKSIFLEFPMRSLITLLFLLSLGSTTYALDVPEVHCLGTPSSGTDGLYYFEFNKPNDDEYFDHDSGRYVGFVDSLNTFRVTERGMFRRDRVIHTPPSIIGGGQRCTMDGRTKMICKIDAYGNDFNVVDIEIDMSSMTGSGTFKSRTTSIIGHLSGMGDIYAEFSDLECRIMD